MNITKIIEEELGQELEKVGFQPAFYERNVWTYERDREGVKHWEFWGYRNEKELRTILGEFKRLIFAYGLDFLETISKPETDAMPTEELEKYLYLNHQRRYEEYSVKLQAERKSAEEAIGIIYQAMKQSLDESVESVKDLLIGIAVLYGHTISWGDRGKWVWDDEEKSCQLQDILGTQYKEYPLRLIVPTWDYWRKHGSIGEGLLERYKTIQVFCYRDHPEEIMDDE